MYFVKKKKKYIYIYIYILRISLECFPNLLFDWHPSSSHCWLIGPDRHVAQAIRLLAWAGADVVGS